jgi:hypothetical protein
LQTAHLLLYVMIRLSQLHKEQPLVLLLLLLVVVVQGLRQCQEGQQQLQQQQ